MEDQAESAALGDPAVMRALQMYRSLPKYLAAKTMGRRMPGILTGPAAPLRLVTIERPRLPDRSGWARLTPRLSGISGSDLAAITGMARLYFTALVSMPFIPGHEVVGVLRDDCGDLARGTRVVLDSLLGCAARGVEPCTGCATGYPNHCNHVTVGQLNPGLQTGFCADTGGGWGGQLIVHRSQLHPVPDEMDDAVAVLIEPLARAIHLVSQARVHAGDHVVVSGAGTYGLFITMALRQLSDAATVTVIAKHPRQRELALSFGASDTLTPEDAFRGVRRSTKAFDLKPDAGRHYLLGGADVSIDAVGSAASINTVLRITRPAGRVVLGGIPEAGVDLAPVWFRELELTGSYASPEHDDGRSVFATAISLAADAAFGTILGARYGLTQWRQALDHAQTAGKSGTVKVAFDLTGER
jgi:threonine dehydrogenase-like Zn-dependent dehydrogenase